MSASASLLQAGYRRRPSTSDNRQAASRRSISSEATTPSSSSDMLFLSPYHNARLSIDSRSSLEEEVGSAMPAISAKPADSVRVQTCTPAEFQDRPCKQPLPDYNALISSCSGLMSYFWHDNTHNGANWFQQPAIATAARQCRATPDFTQCLFRTLSSLEVSFSVIVLSILFIHRRKSKATFRTDPGSEKEGAVTALMIANKVMDDHIFTPKTWARMSQIPLPNLVNMEKQFILDLNFECFVSASEFLSWQRLLEGMGLAKQDLNRKRTASASQRVLASRPAATQTHGLLPQLQPTHSQNWTGFSRAMVPLPQRHAHQMPIQSYQQQHLTFSRSQPCYSQFSCHPASMEQTASATGTLRRKRSLPDLGASMGQHGAKRMAMANTSQAGGHQPFAIPAPSFGAQSYIDTTAYLNPAVYAQQWVDYYVLTTGGQPNTLHTQPVRDGAAMIAYRTPPIAQYFAPNNTHASAGPSLTSALQHTMPPSLSPVDYRGHVPYSASPVYCQLPSTAGPTLLAAQLTPVPYSSFANAGPPGILYPAAPAAMTLSGRSAAAIASGTDSAIRAQGTRQVDWVLRPPYTFAPGMDTMSYSLPTSANVSPTAY